MPSTRADAGASEVPAGSETVLIVEDHETVREVATVMVRSLGYEVLTAADAAEALELIDGARHIDLLVGDIVMSGGVDGFELARRARALVRELSILLMSGYPARGGPAERASSRSSASPTVARNWRSTSARRSPTRLPPPRVAGRPAAAGKLHGTVLGRSFVA